MIAVNVRPETSTLELIDALREQMTGTGERIKGAVKGCEMMAVCRELSGLHEQLTGLHRGLVDSNGIANWEGLVANYETMERLRVAEVRVGRASTWMGHEKKDSTRRGIETAFLFLQTVSADLKRMAEKS